MKFLKDLWVFMILRRKGFSLTYSKLPDNNGSRVCLHHDAQHRIVDVDISEDGKRYAAFCDGLRKKWKFNNQFPLMFGKHDQAALDRAWRESNQITKEIS
jgi:hypothetical protein